MSSVEVPGDDEQCSIYSAINSQLCPNLLSCEDLCQFLSAVRVPVKERDRCRKHILVHMCDKHIVPKPQRLRFGNSRSPIAAPTSAGESPKPTFTSPTKRSHVAATAPSSPCEPRAKVVCKAPPPPISLRRNQLQSPKSQRPAVPSSTPDMLKSSPSASHTSFSAVSASSASNGVCSGVAAAARRQGRQLASPLSSPAARTSPGGSLVDRERNKTVIRLSPVTSKSPHRDEDSSCSSSEPAKKMPRKPVTWP